MSKNSMLSGFPRGSPDGLSLGPSAAFQDSGDIMGATSLQFRIPNEEGRIFLGVQDGAVHEHRLRDGRIERYVLGGHAVGAADDRHIVTIAGSRSGKGRSALVTNLITYPGSVLVIDPKGDLAALTAEWRADILKQKVFVLDPFGVAQGTASRKGGFFNPMTILDEASRTLVEDAGLIADALVMPEPGQKDVHWDESAKQLLEGIILHVATAPEYAGRRNLATVYDCVMERSDHLKNEMLENPAANFAVQLSGLQHFERPDNERNSVMSSLRRHVRFLGYNQIRTSVEGHSFDLRQLKKEHVSVYLSLPAMRMGTCARWLRLFVNLTLAALEEERLVPRYPVLMCLDEFAILGPLRTIEDAAGQIAGLGCKLWPVLQDLGQLQSLYRDRWETFLGNAGLLQFFGNSDMQTLNWISNRMGTTTIRTFSENLPSYTDRSRQGATGQSSGESQHPLMTPEEISRFFGRDDKLSRQLIIRASWPPMVLQRAYYDKHDLFAPYRQYMAAKAQ